MISLRNVRYAYDATAVFENLSLELRSGECTLLVGANGVGKSTLLELCSGLSVPDEGRVLINGTDTREDPARARATIGRVFETPADQLIGETVGSDVAFGPENLGLERAAIRDRVREALAAVGMSDRESASIHALSGGEEARVAIAGALAMDPEHLLLDEPTAGIDHPGRQRILSHLRELSAQGMGIVLATHDLRDLGEFADRVIALADGNVVLDTPPEEASGLEEYGVRVPTEWPGR